MKPNKPYKTEQDYFADKSRLSNSTLSLLTPPAKYKWWFQNSEVVEPSDAMQFGSLAHCMLFEPEQLNERYLFTDVKKKGTKAWAAAEELAAGRVLMKIQHRQQAEAMISQIHNSEMGPVLKDGLAEMIYLADIEEVPFKCKIDFVKMLSEDILIDYKTTRSADPDDFGRSVVNYNYHRQAALYIDIYEASTGREAKAFVFIAQEKDEPYLWGAYSISKGSVEYEMGKKAYVEKIELYKECLSNNHWPNYSENKISELVFPSWAYKNI